MKSYPPFRLLFSIFQCGQWLLQVSILCIVPEVVLFVIFVMFVKIAIDGRMHGEVLEENNDNKFGVAVALSLSGGLFLACIYSGTIHI